MSENKQNLQEEITMSEENKTTTSELGEAELNTVAGGFGLSCCFVHKGSKRRRRDTGEIEMECAGNCHLDRASPYGCLCHGTDRCKDRWHVVTENGSPLPADKHEHWYK